MFGTGGRSQAEPVREAGCCTHVLYRQRRATSLSTPARLSSSQAEARRLIERLEWHYTPKHGSWMNVAEIELSVLARQCLDRRIPELESLRQEVAAWECDRNAEAVKVDWQFTTADARVKLKRLYPVLEPDESAVAEH